MISNLRLPQRVASLWLTALILLLAACPTAVCSQPTFEGWINKKTTLVSPDAAQVLIQQRGRALNQQRVRQANKQNGRVRAHDAVRSIAAASAIADNEFAQLAEALENDPRRIYQFVRNNFTYVPYYGALKGPSLTIKEKSGNDFDQAAVLIELLRAAGFNANYQYGRMTIPVSTTGGFDMAHWLGTEAKAAVISSILGSAGIPATNNTTSVTLDRLWVVVIINGIPVSLDPAFKSSSKQTGINLATAMDYRQGEVLTAAGGLLETDTIANLNATNLGNELNVLTSQLVSYLKQNHPNARMLDIIGGLEIMPDDRNTLPTGLPFPGTPTQLAWTDIPAAYTHTVRLRHGAIDTTLDIPQIAGKKLSISYVNDTTMISPPPIGATDFGTVSPGADSPVLFTSSPSNPNKTVIQVTSTLSGADANAFSFISGGGTQVIPAKVGGTSGSVQVKVKFTGVNQTSGRKNATLTLVFKNRTTGAVIGAAQTIALTGSVVAPPLAQLYLDDLLLQSGNLSSFDQTDLRVTIDHPYAANSGTYADQEVVFTLKHKGAYVLASAFGGDHDSVLLDDRQHYLDRLVSQGTNNTSREVLSETLNIIGQSWMQQTQWADDMLGTLSDQRFIRHHRFGIVGQEDGYFVDIKAQSMASLPLKASAGAGAFQASGLIASALEHGVLEQLQGANQQALSTIKIFSLNNQNGQKFLLAHSGNFTALKTQLAASGYSPYDIGTIQARINKGASLILPQNGQVALNNWRGKGYIDYFANANGASLGMIIGGGLNGGYGSSLGSVSTPVTQAKYSSSQIGSANIATPKGADPVDLGSGAYLNQPVDLSLGGSGPHGLSFARSYNSQQAHQNTAGLGNGWNHGYNIRLTRHSDTRTALGLRAPMDAAPLLVAAYITRDLMLPAKPSLQAWVVGALVAQWASEQIQDKTVTVKLGDRGMSYRQLPDGSYVPPPGITTQLTKNSNGTYELRERFGATLSFNANNQIQSLTDIDGNTLAFSYGTIINVPNRPIPRVIQNADKLTRVRDAYNRTLSLSYANGKLSQITDSQGRSVNYGYTGNDLTSYRDAENNLWQYRYDSLHQLQTVTDPVGNDIVNNVYDDHYRVIQQTAPRQTGSAQYKLHYTGLSAAEEDPQGHRNTYYYDATGRTIAEENALGYKYKTRYDGQGHVTHSIDPLGNVTQIYYDANQNPSQSINALNQTTRFEYDSQQRLIQVTDALNHSSKIDYDAKHHPIAVRNALNQQAVSGYTASGLLQSQTDAKNTTTVYRYDTNGNPTAAQTGNHPPVISQYDAIGRLTSLTDQAGAVTQFQYDKRGLVTQRTDPLGNASTHQYDAVAQAISHTDRNRGTTAIRYTPSGKPSQISYPDNQKVSYTYDLLDHLTSMTDPAGTTTNRYDAAGRLLDHTDPNGFQVKYLYDAAGNLATLNYPGNKTVSYRYDALNRLNSITIDWLNLTERYFYDDAGRLIQANRFNGSLSQYSYDNADRLTRQVHSSNGQILADYQYTLDANGNRGKALVTEPKLPDQLGNGAWRFNYNARQNRLTEIRRNGAVRATPDYDNEGQLIAQGGIFYRFGYAHRLTSQDTSRYVYDGAGNRIKATRNGVTQQYVYDAAGNLLAEADANGTISRYYLYGNGLTALVDAASNQPYTYHFDGTGHTVALTNASRQVVNRYAYDPYGKLAGQTETVAQPFKYAGQVGIMAEGDNLYYMRARYYDANVGRFISEDPAGFVDGANLYAYVGGNPVMGVDPSGLCGPATPACALAVARITQFGIQSYSKLRPAIKGMGLEAHHLIEKRFAGTLGVKANEMLSVALPKAEHQAITNAWRREISYGSGTNSATAETVLAVAAKIYQSSPVILSALGLAGTSGSANATSGGHTSNTAGRK